MKRKLIKQANQAYTITLPIEWIRKNGLTGKEEIDLEVAEKSIIITTLAQKTIQKTKLDAANISNRALYQNISALYVKGIDEIEITAKNEILNLNEIMSNLIGFAIISQKNNIYVIKDLNFGNYPDLDEIFKRVFQMILLFLESAINDVFSKQEEKLDSLKARDIEVNKFCLYLQRSINKKSYPDIIKGRALFTYSFELEKISDEIERFWRTNIKYHPEKKEDIKKIAELVLNGLEKAFDGLYGIDKKASEDIYALREKIREKSMQIKTKDANTIRMIRHLVKIVEEAADLNPLTLLIKN